MENKEVTTSFIPPTKDKCNKSICIVTFTHFKLPQLQTGRLNDNVWELPNLHKDVSIKNNKEMNLLKKD